jgi:hypothetical protein
VLWSPHPYAVSHWPTLASVMVLVPISMVLPLASRVPPSWGVKSPTRSGLIVFQFVPS